MINYRRLIGGDRVSYTQCSGQLGGGFIFSMDFTVSQNFLELVLQEEEFCLKKLAFAFLTD
jgi:hypothetical protein